MNTIYITEGQLKQLKEGILLDELPSDVIDAIYKNETPFRDNPSIPNFFNESYLEKIMKKRFSSIKEELKKIGSIDDFNDNDLSTVLNKLIRKAQEIEKPYRSELEKICYNYVIDLFSVPEDSVTLDLKMVDKVNLSNGINIDPSIGLSDDDTIEDLTQVNEIQDEVYKRRILNMLSVGASICFSSNIKSYLSEIYDINPKLIDLYKKILAINDYLLFVKNDFSISDENKMQLGCDELILGKEDQKPKIKCEGMIFPVLLSETIHGFMELFASHGLPKEKNVLNLVIGKADFLKAEPWDMRIGPSMWEIISDSFVDVDSDIIPFFFKRISLIPTKKFSRIMREILAKTRKGKRFVLKILRKSKEDLEYFKFSDKMTKLDIDKSLINDEFINETEL